MTFTAEPNIGPYLVEATPPNLLEHVNEHIKFLRECKITFTGSIGRGDIPHTKSAMTLLNNIDVLIAGEEADKEVLRFNSGDMMGMIPPATKRYKPDLDLRTQSLMDDGYTEAMINSDRQMWGGSPISFPNDPQWNK